MVEEFAVIGRPDSDPAFILPRIAIAIRDWNGRYDLPLDCGYDQRVTISRIPA